ncbi:MAG: hypothetical protein CXZ00_11365 [Acidobacteria bacterium]|nr:MAG: hypothetical protein CXZ00_11365 [Acidobacteriota bacterium]
MNRDGQKRVLSNIVSPYGLAVISYVLFLFAWLIPPSVYTNYMQERDLMFLDPATFLFYTLCVAAFILGVFLWGSLFPSAPVAKRMLETIVPPVLFVWVPLTIGIALTVIYSVLFIKSNPTLVLTLLALQGSEIKEMAALLGTENKLALVTPFLTGIIWWAAWRYGQLDLKKMQRRLLKFTLVLAIFSVIVAATLTLSRSELMIVISGLSVLLVLRRDEQGRLDARFVARFGIAFGVLIVFLFLSFAFLRGSQAPDVLICQFLGYTFASYNRLAAMVNDGLRYPFAGHGIYLSSVIAFSQSLGHVLPFREAMGSPEYLEVWGSQFGAVSRAGLSEGLIWSGAFGYIFSDVGWFAPLVLFGYGLLCGFLWNAMRAGKLLGVVLYPWCAFCILFWFGTNYLLDTPSSILVLDVMILSVYERLLLKI